MYKRIFVIVLDSCGIGAMKDSAEYGDNGVDTLGHIDDHMPEFHIPNLMSLGIDRLHALKHADKVENVMGYRARLNETSIGKDTMTGHWEMMGLHVKKPFQTFTETGFPDDLIKETKKRLDWMNFTDVVRLQGN